MITLKRLRKKMTGQFNINRLAALAVTVIFALLAGGMVYYGTSQGIGLMSDSNAYIRNAEMLQKDLLGSFANSEMGVNFPPGYAVSLAAVMRGQDPLAGVRWLHVAAGFAVMMLMGHWVWSVSRQNLWVLVAVNLALAVNWALITIYTKVLSELLFMVVLYTALVGMVEFEERRQWRWMVLAGLAFGVGVLFRYAGLFFVPLFVVYAGWQGWGRGKQAAFGMGAAGLLAILPPAAWFVRNQLVVGQALNRGGLEESYAAAKLWQLPTQSLFVPMTAELTGAALVFNLAGLALAGWFLWRCLANWRGLDGPERMTAFVLLAGLVYVALLVVNILFFDPTTPVNDRILVPARGLLVPAFFLMLGQLLGKAKWGGWALLALAVGLVGWHAPKFAGYLGRVAEKGAGYAGSAWKNHPVVAEAKALKDKMIYTNGRDVLYLLVQNGKIDILPFKLHRINRQPMPTFESEMDALCGLVKDGSAVIILFDDFARRVYFPDLQDILDQCGQVPVEHLDGGVLIGTR